MTKTLNPAFEQTMTSTQDLRTFSPSSLPVKLLLPDMASLKLRPKKAIKKKHKLLVPNTKTKRGKIIGTRQRSFS